MIITGRKEFKLKKAKELGIDFAINTTKVDAQEAVKEILNGAGADAIIEASGDVRLLTDSVDMAAQGGRIAIISIFEKKVELDIDKTIFNDIKIFPVTGNTGMNKPTLRLMETKELDLKSIITEKCTLNEIPETLANLKNSNEEKIKIMIVVEQSKSNGIEVKEVLGDTAYSSIENIKYCDGEKMTLIAKSNPVIASAAEPKNDGFEYNGRRDDAMSNG